MHLVSRSGEMVDAVDSKSTAGNSVRVRVSPSAIIEKKTNRKIGLFNVEILVARLRTGIFTLLE